MEIKSYMTRIGQQAREAASLMAKADTATKNRALLFIAQAIRREVALLRAANLKDLDIAKDNGLEAALLDRLTLSDKAIETMATGLEQIASLDDPIGPFQILNCFHLVFRSDKCVCLWVLSVSFTKPART